MRVRPLRLFRLVVEPCNGWEHQRVYDYWAFDFDEAYQQGLAAHGLSAVESLGTWTEVELPIGQRTLPTAHEQVELRSASLPNRIVRQGDEWAVTYHGKVAVVPDLKGIRQIEYLLRRQDESVPASQLVRAQSPGDAVNGDEDQLSIRRQGTTLPPDRGLSRLLKHYDEAMNKLTEDLRQAEARRAIEDVEAIAEKIRMLQVNVRNARSEQNDPEVEKARKAVWSTVNRVIEIIRPQHSQLADHLVASIDLGNSCVYRPTESPSWSFE